MRAPQPPLHTSHPASPGPAAYYTDNGHGVEPPLPSLFSRFRGHLCRAPPAGFHRVIDLLRCVTHQKERLPLVTASSLYPLPHLTCATPAAPSTKNDGLQFTVFGVLFRKIDMCTAKSRCYHQLLRFGLLSIAGDPVVVLTQCVLGCTPVQLVCAQKVQFFYL